MSCYYYHLLLIIEKKLTFCFGVGNWFNGYKCLSLCVKSFRKQKKNHLNFIISIQDFVNTELMVPPKILQYAPEVNWKDYKVSSK